AGELDVAGAAHTGRRVPAQSWPASTGLGSLDGARGSAHLAGPAGTLSGENDLVGPFDTAAWARASSAGTAWVGGTWMGRELTGAGWTQDATWTGRTWSDATWTGGAWADATWTDATWTDATWTDATWTGSGWSTTT